MRDALGDAGLGHSRNRIAAADYYRGSTIGGFGNGASNTNSSFVERRLVKNSHWSIPNNGPGVAQSVGEMRNSLDANIHARMACVSKFNWNGLGNDLVALDWLVAVNHLMIGW